MADEATEIACVEEEPTREGRGRRAAAAVEAWILRHRERLAQGRDMAQVAAMVAPPPMRLGLAAAVLALDGAVTFADARRGTMDPGPARLKGARLAAEGLAIAATARFAPAILARQAGRIAAMRQIVVALETHAARTG